MSIPPDEPTSGPDGEEPPGPRAAGPAGGGPSRGVGRGVAVTLVVLAVGVFVLAEIPRASSPGAPAASSTATTAAGPASTTTTTPVTTTTTTPPHAPKSVKVLVANGTSTAGVAGDLATKLAGAGYSTLAPANASSQVSATAVYYIPGYQGDAVAVASAAGAPPSAVAPLPSSPPVSRTQGADVVVVVGPDLAASLAS